MRIVITQTDVPPPIPPAVAGGLTAAPGGQSGGTICTARVNIFTTVASGTSCVLTNILGSLQTICNRGQFPLSIAPPIGTQVENEGGLNLPATLAVGDNATFAYDQNITWYVIQ